MATDLNALLILPVLIAPACSGLDDTRPTTWVEGAVPDLYFVGDVPAGAGTASVLFATAPLDRQLLIAGVGQGPGQLMDDNRADDKFEYIIINGVTFIHDANGWRYSCPGMGSHGPFAAPEDVARDAVERLSWEGEVVGAVATLLEDEVMVRLVTALRAETARRRVKP